MKRLKGPELKMPAFKRPDVKVPPFLGDVYYDLRERRLLPVVALVVVAIAAVPFLLGGSEEPMPVETPEQAAESVRLAVDDSSGLTVVQAHPGLRDYRKRLRGRTSTDPFRQLHTSVPPTSQLKSVDGGSGGTGSAVGATGTSPPPSEDGSETTESTPPSDGSDGAGAKAGAGSDGGKGASTDSGGGKASEPDNLDGKQLFGFRPNVRFGVAGSGNLNMHKELPLGSLLPEKNAVVLFVGVTQNGERALFNVAPGGVVSGDGACVGGDENCRFLSMRAGDAVNLLTPSGQSFRLKVEDIEFVELEVPPKSKQASGSAAREPKRGIAAQNFSN